ncbi:hypothetical protein AMJ57_00860 [Parcubacteria bacterium SG8_24]|nr:MAG: hypothetical protein AMJ57_00860 [Parcubacteria bacterium SG8_24]
MESISKEVAAAYLRDVDPPWKAFWFHMYRVARNLKEFAAGLETISDDVFRYHVDGQKNDLSRWVQEVVGDSVLARRLDTVRDQQEAARLVQERVTTLETALK